MARIRPETGFETTLSAGITAAATTIGVTTAPTETSGYLMIEPGTSNKEIIKYTGVSSLDLTGVTRGISLTGSSDAAGTGTAHAAGVAISMTNVHYYMEQLANVTEANTWTDDQVFESAVIDIGDGSTDEDETVFANNGDGNKPFVRYDAGDNKWLISNNGVDTYDITSGGSGLSAGDGITIDTSKIYTNPQSVVYAADAEASDTYAIALNITLLAYATGQVFNFKANTVNTGAATLNVDSLGAKTIKKHYDQDLSDGDIVANQIVTVVYDGTNMQMISPTAQPAKYASGSIADLNTASAANNDVTVTVGFTPRIIKLHYWIQGHNDSGASNLYFYRKGDATFIGTTLAYDDLRWTFNNPHAGGADQTPSGSAGVAQSHGKDPTSTGAITVGTDTGANNFAIKVTITINSVAADGFVIRRQTEIGTNPTAALGRISYEAYG